MQEKIDILFNVKNTAFGQGIDKVNSKIDGVKAKNIEMFDEIESRVPGASSVLSALSNPYTAIAAGIGAVITGGIVLGKHLLDVSQEIRTNTSDVKLFFGVAGEEADLLTRKTMAIGKVFKDVSINDISGAASVLQANFKNSLNPEESVDLLNQALLATNGKLDLQEVKEYSSQLAQMGLTAEESVGIMVDGFKKGVFSDKAPDAFKEANLSLREMTQIQKDALLGIGLDHKVITKGFDDGSLSVVGAVKKISAAMNNAGTVAKQTALTDIFKGAGEDAGMEYILGLENVNLQLDSMFDKNDKSIIQKKTLMDLEEKTIAQQQRFAPGMNAFADKWDIVVAQAKYFFYDIIASGIDYVIDVWNNPNFLSMNPIEQLINAFQIAWELTKFIGEGLWEIGKVLWEIGVFAWNVLVDPFIQLFDMFGENNAVENWGNGFISLLVNIKERIFDLLEAIKLTFKSANALLKGDLGGAKNSILDAKQKIVDIGTKDYSLSIQHQNKVPAISDEEFDRRMREDKINNAGDLSPRDKDGKLITAPLNKANDTVSNIQGASASVRNITFNIEALHKGNNIIHKAEKAVAMTMEQFSSLYSDLLLAEVRDVERAV